MSLGKPYLVISLIVGLVGVAGLLSFTRSHWWPRVRSCTVTYDGEAVPGAEVYRGKECFLLRINGAPDSPYVIYPEVKQIGKAIHGRFFYLPGCVYSLDEPATGIPLGKMEVNSEEEFGAARVRFRDTKGKQIVFTW